MGEKFRVTGETTGARRSPRSSMNGYRLETWLPISIPSCLLNASVEDFFRSQVICLVSNEIDEFIWLTSPFNNGVYWPTFDNNGQHQRVKRWLCFFMVKFHDWNLGLVMKYFMTLMWFFPSKLGISPPPKLTKKKPNGFWFNTRGITKPWMNKTLDEQNPGLTSEEWIE